MAKSTFRARPPSIFITCHKMPQRWQCDSQKTRNTTRLKCCACHAKWHRRCPKCCACHEKCNASSATQTTFDTSWNMLECHKVPRLPREMKLCDAGKLMETHGFIFLRFDISKRDPFCRTSHRHGHSNLARTVADGCGRSRTNANSCENGCGRLCNVWRTQLNSHTPIVKREPLLCSAFGKRTLEDSRNSSKI